MYLYLPQKTKGQAVGSRFKGVGTIAADTFSFADTYLGGDGIDYDIICICALYIYHLKKTAGWAVGLRIRERLHDCRKCLLPFGHTRLSSGCMNHDYASTP